MENILITGITGQDGIFLTKQLIDKKENFIVGITRKNDTKTFYNNLSSLGVNDHSNIQLMKVDLTDQKEVQNLIKKFKFDYVYNLSGPSSVYESLKNPFIGKMIENIFDNLINGCKKNNITPRFFQASSSEMFEINEGKLNENSKMKPRNPYSLSKLRNHQKVINLNKDLEWNIFSGVLFNHESEFRSAEYLFPKIIKQTKEIAEKKRNVLKIGSLEYQRDWSFAGDIAIAIKEITLNGTKPTYVVGSGTSTSIKFLIDFVFDYFGLNPEKYIEIDEKILRPNDPLKIVSDPSLINRELNWRTAISIEKLIKRCIKLI